MSAQAPKLKKTYIWNTKTWGIRCPLLERGQECYNNNNNNNNNNLYLKRVTQSNGKDLPWGPLACLQVVWGPQGYKVVQYIAFRYRDLKEGRDGAHLIASVKPFQTLGPEYEMHFWPIQVHLNFCYSITYSIKGWIICIKTILIIYTTIMHKHIIDKDNE